MKVEAYLGQNLPKTIAVGEVTENLSELQWAVVKFARDADPNEPGEFVEAYTHYGPAVSAVNRQTTSKHYGVLCKIRPALTPADEDYGDDDPDGGSK